jgi:alpha/beta superfamily hydrolase
VYKNVELKAGNKLLRGTVTAPADNAAFPTVIFFHGFTMDRVGLRGLHEKFARECVKNSFACVRFDFYGLGQSDGDFSEMTPSSEVEQAIAIYAWVCAQEFSDTEKVFFAGHSLGGAVAAMAAPVSQPKALILWAPAISLYLPIIERAKNTGGKVAGGYDLGGILLSDAFIEDIKHLDVAQRSQGYQGKVLLLHGGEDEQVQVESAYLFQDVYREAVEIKILPCADHQFSRIEWREEIYSSSIAYINKIING